MNERIKELAKQAGDYVNETYTGPVRSKTPGKIWEDGHIGWHTQFNQKFAELIVRECATLAFDGPNGILEHFGVNDNSIKVGSRIKVVSKFNVGARGTVNYIEPSGKLWVRRDGASSDVSYNPEEVIGDD